MSDRNHSLGTDQLLETLRAFCHPWRRLTIGVDGWLGAGKSTLARHLAWQLGMPVLETDLWRASGDEPSFEQLRKLIACWHERDRPVIVEGIRLLETFEQIGIAPDYFVLITNFDEPHPDHSAPRGTLSRGIADYLAAYRPLEKADYAIRWRPSLLRSR